MKLKKIKKKENGLGKLAAFPFEYFINNSCQRIFLREEKLQIYLELNVKV